MPFLRSLIVASALTLLPVAALAQGAKIAFGNVQQDTSQPVEVTADNLDVNQNDGTAIFTGNVLIGQGEMRLSAPKVRIYYNEDGDRIEKMKASGGVTLVSGDDAAEAAEAEYNIDAGLILMRGNVLLVQKKSALTAERMNIDIKSGTARMEGRVKTVLPGNE
ncbi:lipopolysaccharide transport periplasmic protein LptA [Marimonas arenosa]|uniref:Lipopolysaccharide transport periplasmic protein LptA n=1 Tax=Marimonas arenosa TaxID=1795305 RepID=A0AAE3WEV5_9RHOB|nr:lipopolysaccharide transport periplasmic protein LptA [Marimonas arenosa]MDQ2090358.1 lipopolysaccharide transport periplasmic protein LptA [Marimonas arenosa]